MLALLAALGGGGMLAAAMMLFMGMLGSAQPPSDLYHPAYPPTSAEVVDLTPEDVEAGRAGYLKYEGREVRLLRPAVAVWQQIQFSRVSIKVGDREVGIKSWNHPRLKVVSVKHIKVLKADPEFPQKHWSEHVDVVLETPTGEKAHWLWGVFPNLGRSRADPDIPSDPVEDSINQTFVLADSPAVAAPRRAGVDLAQVLDDGALASLPEPPRAPPLASVTGEERAAAERLIALLESSPGEGIMEALPYAKNYAFHEVAVALVVALEQVESIPQRQGNTYQECAMSVLGTIGDPIAVDPLVRFLEDPYRYHRRKAMNALAEIGSYRALAPLYKATRTERWQQEAMKAIRIAPKVERYTIQSEEQINAVTALNAMCAILGGPESREFFPLKPYQEAVRAHPDSADAHLKYAALCHCKACPPLSAACDTRLIRESVKEFQAFLGLEPEGPRAAIAGSILEAMGRLHGL